MIAAPGSRRHVTTSLSENVIMAKTSYEMLEVLSFSDREKIKVLTFLVKK